MSGIVVNELVTKFTARYDRSFSQYEKMLSRMDKNGQKMGDRVGKSFSSSFDKAAQRISSRMAQALKNVSSQARNLKVSPQVRIVGVSRAKAELKSLEIYAGHLNKNLSGISLGGAITGGIAALGIGKAAGFGLNAAKEYESAITRLNSMLGEKNARPVFKQLQTFADKTPYELVDTLEMFTKLQGSGFGLLDKSTGKIDYKRLTAIGDVTSRSGLPLSEMTEMILGLGKGRADRFDNFSAAGLAGAVASGGLISGQILRDGKLQNFELEASDKQGIMDLIVGQGLSSGVAGGMEALSKTLEGQMSTITDKFKNLSVKMWLGMEKPVHKFLDQLIKGLDKMEPKFRAIGVQVGLGLRKVPAIVQAISKWAPLAAGGIGLMGAKIIGLKYMAAAEVLGKIAFEMRSVGLATYFANGMFKGLLVGGALTGLVALFADFIYYLNTGDSKLVEFTKKWPELSKWIKDAYYWNGIFVDALMTGFKKLLIQFNDFFAKLKLKWDDFVETTGIGKLFLTPHLLSAAGDLIQQRIFGDTGGADLGSPSSAANAAKGSGNMAAVARGFAIGAPGQSAADIWAKSASKVDGMAIKTLYKTGVACAASVEEIARLAGANPAILSALTPSAPDSYKNLLDRGLAELVPYNQLQGGEIFYEWSKKYNTWGHTGIVGDGGRTFLHASTDAGKKTYGSLGMKQRFASTPNYLGDSSSGAYLRIKPQYLNGGAMPNVTNNITINAGSQAQGRDIARQVSKGAEQGTSKALTKATSRYSQFTSE